MLLFSRWKKHEQLWADRTCTREKQHLGERERRKARAMLLTQQVEMESSAQVDALALPRGTDSSDVPVRGKGKTAEMQIGG